jgi:PEP-CTERM motif
MASMEGIMGTNRNRAGRGLNPSRLTWKQASGALCFCVVLAVTTGSVRADFQIAYNAPGNPQTQGFTTATIVGSPTFGPIANDQGHPAWAIAGFTQNSQFGYLSGALTALQKADVANQGFDLTLTARVLQGLAPAYDSTNHITLAAAVLDNGIKRFEIDLGVNGNGDTVAVLPTSIDSGGPGGSIRSPGQSFTLTGSGSTYHTYDLIYNPTTQLADLYVDGIDRIQGYAGHTSFVGDRGLEFAAFSGGEGNFNLVQVSSLRSVPEPASLTMFVLGGAGLIGHSLRKRRHRAARM